MPVVTATDAPVFDTDGAVITGLASPSRGAKHSAAWHVRFRPDHSSPAHELSHEEVFVVLAGAVTAVFADREETASAGGALIVPAGQRFSLIAREAAAEAVCVLPVGGKASTGDGEFTPPWAE